MKKVASYSLMIIFFVGLLFNLAMVLGIVPSAMSWGGRLQSPTQELFFGLLSVLVNLFFIWTVWSFIKNKPYYLFFKIIFWLMAFVFALNTLGNLNSHSFWEKILFTPVTFLATVFAVSLARNRH